MSTLNIGFYEEMAKISFNYYQISSNTHLIYSSEMQMDICITITKTRPCNIQRFFTAVKMTIFS